MYAPTKTCTFHWPSPSHPPVWIQSRTIHFYPSFSSPATDWNLRETLHFSLYIVPGLVSSFGLYWPSTFSGSPPQIWNPPLLLNAIMALYQNCRFFVTDPPVTRLPFRWPVASAKAALLALTFLSLYSLLLQLNISVPILLLFPLQYQILTFVVPMHPPLSKH